MEGSSTRRQLFRGAWGEVMADARRRAGLPEPPAREEEPVPPAAPGLQPVPAPARCATIDELLVIAAELGLDAHADSVAALAITSWRMTPCDEPTPERLWSDLAPYLADDAATRVMRLADLGESVCASAGLDAGGDLRVAFDATPALEGAWAPVRCDVRSEPGDAAGAGTPVAAHPELVLPRAWSARVQRLGLARAELDAWEALRERLAEAQGTELPQGEWQALHRLLGYPDERQGLMPEICGQASGVPADRWVLVLQVTLEPVPAVPSLSTPRRAYLWADEDALRAGDLSSAAHVIVQ